MGLFSSLGNIIVNPVGEMNKAVIGQFDGSSQQADANAMAMKSWNLMNDYNHPINQMERLKAAGLNPLLVYGSGSVAGNTTSAPALTGGNISTAGETLLKLGSKTMNLLQGAASIENTKAQTQASVAAAGASGAQAANLNAQAALTSTRNKYEEKSLIADIDYKQALAKKTEAEAAMAQGEARLFGDIGGSKGAGTIATAAGKAGKYLKSIFGR